MESTDGVTSGKRMMRNDPTVRDEFPVEIRRIDTAWITMSDGVRLAATIWLPGNAELEPVPAILEYLPYRRDTGASERDAMNHPYFAGYGYACVRVDIRGTGDSDGILEDEYLPLEQSDGVEVINWIASQPWCSGVVGMIGISWGGFNGLQIAAHRPEPLKAIVTICSTDDRYADDVHYMGGCVVSDMLPWASTMLAKNALPPRPAVVGERWREMWLHRLEKTPAYIESWLSHQRRDEFWKQGSVCEEFGRISCAVLAVGGWYDAYTNAVPRLLEGMSSPRRGIIGPWPHKYPNQASPGPQIGFLQECLRWWDQWLKGTETGVMDEPMLRAWILDSPEPSASYDSLPGYWVSEHEWPPQHLDIAEFYPGTRGLASSSGKPCVFTVIGDQSTGQDSGVWCAYGASGDFAPDQRGEDGRSLCFTTEPLAEPLEILGCPEVALRLNVDRPLALVALRLCDVSPTGESALISRGQLNLTHRHSHEDPESLDPGKDFEVSLKLNAIGWRVPAGHRIRLAISPTYWPFAWPSPEPVTLSVICGDATRLLLPVRRSIPDDIEIKFPAAEISAPLEVDHRKSGSREVTKQIDQITGETVLVYSQDSGLRYIRKTGVEYRVDERDEFSIIADDPLSATVSCWRDYRIAQGDWRIRVVTESTLTSDASCFHISNAVTAWEGETEAFARTSHKSIPRDLV